MPVGREEVDKGDAFMSALELLVNEVDQPMTTSRIRAWKWFNTTRTVGSCRWGAVAAHEIGVPICEILALASLLEVEINEKLFTDERLLCS